MDGHTRFDVLVSLIVLVCSGLLADLHLQTYMSTTSSDATPPASAETPTAATSAPPPPPPTGTATASVEAVKTSPLDAKDSEAMLQADFAKYLKDTESMSTSQFNETKVGKAIHTILEMPPVERLAVITSLTLWREMTFAISKTKKPTAHCHHSPSSAFDSTVRFLGRQSIYHYQCIHCGESFKTDMGYKPGQLIRDD